MILYAVRWQENEDAGFTRSEFIKPQEAMEAAKEFQKQKKLNVNIKLVDTKNDKFIGEIEVESGGE